MSHTSAYASRQVISGWVCHEALNKIVMIYRINFHSASALQLAERVPPPPPPANIYLNFFFVLFVLLYKLCPLAVMQVLPEKCLLLNHLARFCGSMIPPQVWRNNIYWIDVSQSNTLSKYICIHWAALLNHIALAAALQDILHPEGDTGRPCKAPCWLLKCLYLCIS